MNSYLNLSRGFNPFNSTKENTVEFQDFIFSGGEPHIKLKSNAINLTITSRIKNSDDLIKIALAKDAYDALWNGFSKNVKLFIPYFPGARQDRRMITGEPLSVKVYADFINSLGFSKVTIMDPHSDVTPSLLNKCEVLNNYDLVYESMLDINIRSSELLIVSPDSGANKKSKDLLKAINSKTPKFPFDLLKCDKTRNVVTGAIEGFEVYSDDLQGKHCLIVDDICDGGGTFIGLAEELKRKNAGDIYLFVTHGIFSKGFTDLKMFKNIYSSDSFEFYNDLRGDKQVKTIKIELQ